MFHDGRHGNSQKQQRNISNSLRFVIRLELIESQKAIELAEIERMKVTFLFF